MQKALGRATEAVTSAMESNKKAADMKSEMKEPTSKDPYTSDFGVKGITHDTWLSASTGDRTGPALLEDGFGREKVRFQIQLPYHICSSANITP